MQDDFCFNIVTAFVFRTHSQPRQGAVQRVWGATPTSKNGFPAATLEVRFERLYIQTPCMPLLYQIRYKPCYTKKYYTELSERVLMAQRFGT